MKKLILLVTLIVVILPQLCYPEEEVVWETEQIPYLHDVLVAPQSELLYNINGKTLEIRRISDGVKIDSIIMENIPNYLYKMSITDDGRYIAFSGDNPYVIIYGLQERKEVKRITTIAYEREEYGKNVIYNTEQWTSSSISPDGTKITGIATASDGEMTNFVVIDIATEMVLFEQRRITYDHFNPEEKFHKWHTSEFSPSGDYIVAQMEYREENNVNAPDSVYIYKTETFEFYDVVLNNYDNEYNAIEFSNFSPIFSFVSNRTYFYNLQSKTIIETSMNSDIWGLTYSRNSNQVIYGFDWNCEIYNFETKGTSYKYENLFKPEATTLDNSKLISVLYNNIYCLNTYWITTSIENNDNEVIITPNPTNGTVNITLDCLSPQITYQIINSTGQNLETKLIDNYNTSLTINFSNYPVGIYYLTINCNQNLITYKIAKEG